MRVLRRGSVFLSFYGDDDGDCAHGDGGGVDGDCVKWSVVSALGVEEDVLYAIFEMELCR